MQTTTPTDDTPVFTSPLAPYLAQLLAEKRALGYKYHSQALLMRRLDAFVTDQGDGQVHLSKALVLQWIARRPHEQAGTQWLRIHIVRQVGHVLVRAGIPAYLPERTFAHPESYHFTPYIFSLDEIHRVFAAADALPPNPNARRRHRIMPVLFRVLYGCGLRMNEALRLQRRDVDLDQGLLTIRQGKFRKDRLVPMADGLTRRLTAYLTDTLGPGNAEDYVFPAPDGGPYSASAVYHTFRALLWRSGIAHGGAGAGPRVHDLRHAHAVHCLQQWVRTGADLTALLPVLATYLGHTKLTGTQRYLRLTAELYPDILATVEAQCGQAIPERRTP